MSLFSSKVLMIEPTSFEFNEETGQDNSFMTRRSGGNFLSEFLAYKQLLENLHIQVIHWKNPDLRAKDCIFANNWFSSFAPPLVNVPTLVLCPMKHPSRRLERREEFVQELMKSYENFIDLTYFEAEEKYLEGTGSMVIDRTYHKIFMSLSDRSSEEVLDHLIERLNAISQFRWTKVCFRANDERGKSVYHTNVVLSLTDNQAILSLASVALEDRDRVLNELSGYELVEISHEDTKNFAGNLESLNSDGKTIAILSSKARAMNDRIKCPLHFIDLSEIEEIGGGSAQCMLAKLF